MYISVKSYEEKYLAGKDVSALNDEINKLRREIARSKSKLESPVTVRNISMARDIGAIDVYRSYLMSALQYLADVTGDAPAFTEEEKASAAFDSTVDSISCVTLTYGRYLQNKYELAFEGGGASIVESKLECDPTVRSVDPAVAYETIRSLRLGEWRDNYNPEQYGCTLNDPTLWQIRIDYGNGASPRFFDGVGVFPYNFSVLCRLMGADVI